MALTESGVAAAQQPGAAIVYAVVEFDASAFAHNELGRVSSSIVTELAAAQPAIDAQSNDVAGDVARVQVGRANVHRALQVIGSTAEADLPAGSLVYGQDGDAITARLTPLGLRRMTSMATTLVMEILRRRIDPDDARSVVFENLGESRLAVSARGLQDPQEMTRLIGPIGALTFNLVDDTATPRDIAAGHIPTTDFVAQPFPGIGRGAVVVERHPQFTGEQLDNASPAIDHETGTSVLAFKLKDLGTRLFCRITREHIAGRFAILFDNKVLTAPVINEPICGGQGQIVSTFTPQSASDLSRILNAGALPVPLRIIETGVGTGPSRR